MIETCTHLGQIRKVTPSADGCEDCLNEIFIEPEDLFRAYERPVPA